MRRKIYEMIELADPDDKLSRVYDIIMMFTIFISLLPLAFKENNLGFTIINYAAAVIFIVDYVLRLITADYKLKTRSTAAFFVYPITPMAMIDLIVILSSFPILSGGLKVLKVLRLMRTLRVLRVMKFLRYSKSLVIIVNVLRKEKRTLSAVATLAIAYILISALVIFNIEPDSFDSFFDAVYWATVSLTTVGYGDIYPTTTLGRMVTMFSSIFGIAIIALPSGIITGGYLREVNKEDIGQPDIIDKVSQNKDK